jgi:hypothetical protein
MLKNVLGGSGGSVAAAGSDTEIQYNNAGVLGASSSLVWSSGLTASAPTATDIPTTIKGAASQTGNLTEWQNSAGTVLAKVEDDGSFDIGSTPTFRANVSNDRVSLGTTTASGVLNIGGDRIVTFVGGNASITNSSATTYTASIHTFQTGDIRVNADVDGAAVNIVPKDTSEKPLSLKQYTAGTTTMVGIYDSSGTQTMGLTTSGLTQAGAGSGIARFDVAHTVAPTSADGDGVGLTLQTENNSGTLTDVAYLDAVYDDISLHQASLRFSLKDDSGAGSTPSEVARFSHDGLLGINNSSPGARLDMILGASTEKGAIIKAAASQTANLTEWQNSSATVLSSVAADGNISVPDEAYGAGWNGSTEVPTKNAVYDKIEALSASAWTSWSPTYGGANGLTLTGTPTTTEAYYREIEAASGETTCEFYLLASVTTNASGGSLKVSLPVATSITNETQVGVGHRRSGGWTTRQALICAKQGTNIFCEAEGGTAWSASTTYGTVTIFGQYRVY